MCIWAEAAKSCSWWSFCTCTILEFYLNGIPLWFNAPTWIQWGILYTGWTSSHPCSSYNVSSVSVGHQRDRTSEITFTSPCILSNIKLFTFCYQSLGNLGTIIKCREENGTHKQITRPTENQWGAPLSSPLSDRSAESKALSHSYEDIFHSRVTTCFPFILSLWWFELPRAKQYKHIAKHNTLTVPVSTPINSQRALCEIWVISTLLFLKATALWSE